MVRDSLPSEDDPVESDGVDRMINDLYLETMQMSSSANRKAAIFKYLYVLAAIYITIAGAVIGALTVQGFSSDVTKYVAAVLGFVITAVQALVSTFSIQSRSVLLRDVSNRLRKVSRNLKNLQNSDMKPRDKMKRLEDFYTDVDELDMSMFDNTITTVSNSKPESNEVKRSDSDLSSNSDSEDDSLTPKNILNPPLFTPKESPPSEAARRGARQFINLLRRRQRQNKSSDDDQPSPDICTSLSAPSSISSPSPPSPPLPVSILHHMNSN
jgi:hypothetical protein